jgi:hypothetical protein
MPPLNLSDPEIADFVGQLAAYIHAQRERYLLSAFSLPPEQAAALRPFFPGSILQEALVVVRGSDPISDPPGIPDRQRPRVDLLPDLNRLNVVTFLDMQVLQQLSDRALFHGLVHTVQYNVVGFERCLDINVRNFLRTGRHVTSPLFVHAFQLEHRFTHSAGAAFAVEDEVKSWHATGRYTPNAAAASL